MMGTHPIYTNSRVYTLKPVDVAPIINRDRRSRKRQHDGVKIVLDDWVLGGKRIHSLDTMGHNWWPTAVFGAGVGAMAILDDDPRARDWVWRVRGASDEWLRYAGSVLENKPANFDTDGAFYESVGYTEGRCQAINTASE